MNVQSMTVKSFQESFSYGERSKCGEERLKAGISRRVLGYRCFSRFLRRDSGSLPPLPRTQTLSIMGIPCEREVCIRVDM